jgi:hypothetical protein
MITQYIRVQSDKERSDAFDQASKRHDAITTWRYAPKGTIMCCPSVIPLVKFGGGVLTTFRCPLCGRTKSWWGWEDAFESTWNSWFQERSIVWKVGINFLPELPDDEAIRIPWSAEMESMHLTPRVYGERYTKRLLEVNP